MAARTFDTSDGLVFAGRRPLALPASTAFCAVALMCLGLWGALALRLVP